MKGFFKLIFPWLYPEPRVSLLDLYLDKRKEILAKEYPPDYFDEYLRRIQKYNLPVDPRRLSDIIAGRWTPRDDKLEAIDKIIRKLEALERE